MDDVTRRNAIKLAAAAGIIAVGGAAAADDKKPKDEPRAKEAGPILTAVTGAYSYDPVFDDTVLYAGEESAYGATVYYKLVMKSPTKHCLEGKLTYGRVVPLGGGELCVEQTNSGEYTVKGQAEIKAGGKVVARAEVSAVLRITGNGTAEFVRANLRVCGSNGVKLKCKDFSVKQLEDEKRGDK